MNLLGFGSLAACVTLAISPASSPKVFPPTAHPYGHSYAEWSARAWKMELEHSVVGHPFVDDPAFDVTSGQEGKVWFLASIVDFGGQVAHTRSITVPKGKALFLTTLAYEQSSNEGSPTESEQRAIANSVAVEFSDLSCTIDGELVSDIDQYRFESAQFTFTAPDPWIFSPAPSGPGTAVADGSYLLIKPLKAGLHVIHFTGLIPAFGASSDITYVVTVQ